MTEYSDTIQSMFDGNRANARTATTASINDSPDDAARALELSEATGVDASIIHGDVEGFEQQHKAGLASKIVNDNQYISDYVNSHPLAAKLSNDDYGQLDTVSGHLQRLGIPKVLTSVPDPFSMLGAMGKAFKEDFGPLEFGSWYDKRKIDEEFQANHPMLYRHLRNTLFGVGVPVEVFNRTLSGGLAAFGAGARNIYKQYGGDDQNSDRFGQAIQGMAESHLMTGHKAEMEPHKAGEFEKLVKDAHEALNAAKPYIDAGVEPPVGVHPKIDEAHKEQAKLDNKTLDEIFKESQASKTRERNPEIFAGFIRQHTDAKIGISAEEVRKLYGDKDPRPDDGKLGFVPDLAEQLRIAEATGGDVEIPLADWVAKTDPTVAKDLHDFIRVRPGGMTLEEAKGPKAKVEKPEESEFIDVYHGTNEDFKDFDLAKAKNKYERSVFFAGESVHAEDYVNEDKPGKVLAARLPRSRGLFADKDMFDFFSSRGDVTTNLTNYAKGQGKDFVEMDLPGAGKIYMVHNPEVIRDLRVHKVIDTIRSASALRPLEDRTWEKANKFETGSIPLRDYTPEHLQNLTAMLGKGEWIGVGDGYHGFFPTEFYKEHEAKIIAAVDDTLNRIIPKFTENFGVRKIAGKGGDRPRGLYVQFQDRIPIILYALDSVDPVGTGRHEAIHHLRRYGFFTDEEWGTLSKAAEEEGWIKKYDIDKRYGEESYETQIEEAIADHFKQWDRELDTKGRPTRPYDAAFEKLKRLLREIKLSIGRVIGDKTVDDLFHKVEKGEIGSREGTKPLEGAAFRPKADVGEDKIFGKFPKTRLAPALKTLDGEIHIGKEGGIHSDIYKDIPSKGISSSGFVTPDGQYLERAEALKWANENGPKVTQNLDKQTLDAHDYRTSQVLKPRADVGKGEVGKSKKELIKAPLEGEILSPGNKHEFDQVPWTAEHGNPWGMSDEDYAVWKTKPENKEAVEEWNRDNKIVEHAKIEQPQIQSEEAEKAAFAKANAIGMTVAQYNRYQRLIAKRNAEDQAFQLEQAKKQATREQSKEWKENEAKVRDEVAPEMVKRPDIAADSFFREGTLNGAKLENTYKLGTDFLTEEQKAALPKEYYSKLGVNPDDVAGIFGYQSGDTMVGKIVDLNSARKELGMGPKEYLKYSTDQEVARQMSEKYGNLDENILAEAKEHVISETQMDMLHEEVAALGMKAGGSFEISKADIQSWVKGEFDRTQISRLKTDKFLASAGKAGRLAEDALLKADYTEAFKAKQQQYLAMLMAKAAKGLEKSLDQFDRTAKRMSKREIPGMEAEYTNWVHDILMRVGQPVRRSIQDLQEAIGKEAQDNLKDFVTAKQADLREVPVADFLYDANFRKKFDDLTAEEFDGVHGSIKTLVKNGRDEKKIYKDGEASDLKSILDRMKDQLKDIGPVIPGQREVGTIKKRLQTYIAAMTNTETLLNEWDKNNPRGIFNQFVMRPLIEAASNKSTLERKYAKEYRELGEVKDPKKEVDNHLFFDPSMKSEDNPKGELFKFNRLNLLSILQNVGNPGNLNKLLKAYNVEPRSMMSWLFQHTTKEDWDRAQALGDLFARIKHESDGMYYRLSGVSPENIELHEINTPFGTYKGWYHPLIADPLMLAEKGKVRGDALEGNEYFRATTPAGYTKSRTGAVYPLDLSFDQIPNRINQMLHDIAFREAIVQASKVFYDKGFINEVTRRQGEVYAKGLEPYLRDVANGANFNSFAKGLGAKTSEYFRQNVIGTYVGMNPGTVMKHGPTAMVNSVAEVGVKNFAQAVSSLFSKDATTGESNWTFAMQTSEELQRRSRNWRDTTVGAHKEAISEPTLREKIMELGTVPVALSDLLSAVPTWLAQYNKSILEVDHGQAVYEADRAVRRAHGSTAITNLPAIARGGPLNAWITSLYGFFGNQMQRRFEIAWDMNKTAKLVGDGEFIKASKNVPRIAANIFAYVILPSIIEDQVESQIAEDKQGFIRRGAGILAKGISSSFIGARDLVHGFSSGHEPSVGLLSAMLHDIANVQKDVAKGWAAVDKQHVGNTIMHAITFFGNMTGYVNQSEGRALKYIVDYATGQQKPRGPSDVVRGIHHGSQKITSPIENELLPEKVRK